MDPTTHKTSAGVPNEAKQSRSNQARSNSSNSNSINTQVFSIMEKKAIEDAIAMAMSTAVSSPMSSEESSAQSAPASAPIAALRPTPIAQSCTEDTARNDATRTFEGSELESKLELESESKLELESESKLELESESESAAAASTIQEQQQEDFKQRNRQQPPSTHATDVHGILRKSSYRKRTQTSNNFAFRSNLPPHVDTRHGGEFDVLEDEYCEYGCRRRRRSPTSNFNGAASSLFRTTLDRTISDKHFRRRNTSTANNESDSSSSGSLNMLFLKSMLGLVVVLPVVLLTFLGLPYLLLGSLVWTLIFVARWFRTFVEEEFLFSSRKNGMDNSASRGGGTTPSLLATATRTADRKSNININSNSNYSNSSNNYSPIHPPSVEAPFLASTTEKATNPMGMLNDAIIQSSPQARIRSKKVRFQPGIKFPVKKLLRQPVPRINKKKNTNLALTTTANSGNGNGGATKEQQQQQQQQQQHQQQQQQRSLLIKTPPRLLSIDQQDAKNNHAVEGGATNSFHNSYASTLTNTWNLDSLVILRNYMNDSQRDNNASKKTNANANLNVNANVNKTKTNADADAEADTNAEADANVQHSEASSSSTENPPVHVPTDDSSKHDGNNDSTPSESLGSEASVANEGEEKVDDQIAEDSKTSMYCKTDESTLESQSELESENQSSDATPTCPQQSFSYFDQEVVEEEDAVYETRYGHPTTVIELDGDDEDDRFHVEDFEEGLFAVSQNKNTKQKRRERRASHYRRRKPRDSLCFLVTKGASANDSRPCTPDFPVIPECPSDEQDFLQQKIKEKFRQAIVVESSSPGDSKTDRNSEFDSLQDREVEEDRAFRLPPWKEDSGDHGNHKGVSTETERIGDCDPEHGVSDDPVMMSSSSLISGTIGIGSIGIGSNEVLSKPEPCASPRLGYGDGTREVFRLPHWEDGSNNIAGTASNFYQGSIDDCEDSLAENIVSYAVSGHPVVSELPIGLKGESSEGYPCTSTSTSTSTDIHRTHDGVDDRDCTVVEPPEQTPKTPSDIVTRNSQHGGDKELLHPSDLSPASNECVEHDDTYANAKTMHRQGNEGDSTNHKPMKCNIGRNHGDEENDIRIQRVSIQPVGLQSRLESMEEDDLTSNSSSAIVENKENVVAMEVDTASSVKGTEESSGNSHNNLAAPLLPPFQRSVLSPSSTHSNVNAN